MVDCSGFWPELTIAKTGGIHHPRRETPIPGAHMGILKPWLGQGYVMRLEPSRRASTIVGVLLMGLALGGLLWLRERRESPSGTLTGDQLPPDALTFLTWAATVVLLLGFVMALVNGRRWWLNRRIVRLSMSKDGRELRPRTEWTVDGARAQRVPRLSIEDGWTRRDRRVKRRLRRVTSTSNVIGEEPIRVAYLRIFDNQPRSRTFLQGAWREFGYVYMLRSASSVSPAEFRGLRRYGVEEMFVSSHKDLDSELAMGESSPQRTRLRGFRHLAPTVVRTYDGYGAFPPVAVLCHGSFWRAAVDELLLRVDAVCLDLSGFRPKHEGTGYELQRVIDRFPIERVLFLADPKSNLKFLGGEIDRAWRQMSADSPNTNDAARTTHMAVTDRVRITITQNEHGQETRRETRLIAQRKQTRRIAAGLQLAIASAPPVRREPWGTPATAPTPVEVSQTYRSDSLSSPLGWIAALVLALLTVFGLAIAAPGLAPGVYAPKETVATKPSITTESVTVPDVVEERVRSAKRQLEQQGFEVSVGRVQDDAPRGTVIGQSPSAGTEWAEGSTVRLTVSAGRQQSPDPQLTTVPQVVGESLKDAEKMIIGANLEPLVADEPVSSSLSAGTVVDCEPGEGESADEGTTVELVVASGFNSVPNLVGKQQSEAEQYLKEEGFEVTITKSETEEVASGEVTGQSADAGTSLAVGTSIELTVAISPTETPTPSPSPASIITSPPSPTP